MEQDIDITRGLVFSQRVMLALIDKGMSRKQAYGIVQRNAMKVWQQNRRFLTLLKADAEVTAVMTMDEIEAMFDYQYYLRHIDDIFERLGLTKAQWQMKKGNNIGLAPTSM